MLATELRERGNLIKGIEVFQHDRARTDCSRTAKRIAPPKEITGTSAPNLGAESGARAQESVSPLAPVEGKRRDPIWPGKYLIDSRAVWSLSTSKEFHGELPVMLAETKELLQQEAILFHEREREADKWKWLEVLG